MAANFNLFNANWLRSRENTQLDCKMRSFEFSDRRKSIVVKSGGASCFCYGAVQRKLRQNGADTAPQFSAQIKRKESAAKLGKVRSGRLKRNLTGFECGGNGIVGETQQQSALFPGELLRSNF